MEDNSKGQISNFNEASLKMIRIHESQRLINRLRVNMLAIDYETKLYHYEIIISELVSLLFEVEGKMNATEMKQCDAWKTKIYMLKETLPLKRRVLTEQYGRKQTKTWIDNISWQIMRTNIFQLESFVRKQIEVHGLSSPNQEMEALWD